MKKGSLLLIVAMLLLAIGATAMAEEALEITSGCQMELTGVKNPKNLMTAETTLSLALPVCSLLFPSLQNRLVYRRQTHPENRKVLHNRNIHVAHIQRLIFMRRNISESCRFFPLNIFIF